MVILDVKVASRKNDNEIKLEEPPRKDNQIPNKKMEEVLLNKSHQRARYHLVSIGYY